MPVKTVTKKTRGIHKVLSIIILATGILLAIFKIIEDSEPGAIPLLLIITGIGWFTITTIRRKAE